MGTTHRSKLEQQIEMLRLLKTEDRTQTALCYGSNMNQSKGADLIVELAEKCLMAWNEDRRKFWLTPVGNSAIRAYDKLRRLI